jgi:hypothetical protein
MTEPDSELGTGTANGDGEPIEESPKEMHVAPRSGNGDGQDDNPIVDEPEASSSRSVNGDGQSSDDGPFEEPAEGRAGRENRSG